MCGVFAVAGSKDAAAELYITLTHQQHRGQDAAGILTSDSSGKLGFVRQRGLAADIFGEETIRQLKGSMGIAHNRYPTAGYGDISECQPFLVEDRGIGIAFNGNIVNYPQLKRKMEAAGKVFMSSSDGELLLHVFSDAYSRASPGSERFFAAVKEVQERLVGGYSVVGIVGGEGIFAFKDPYGIRPLLFGRRDNGSVSYAFASESIALSIEGYSGIRDLGNGEAVFVGKGLDVAARVVVAREHKPCVFEFVYFSTIESVLEGIPVYDARKRLGEALASKVRREHPDLDVDVVIPVPDTSRTAANSLARALALPYEEGLVKNRYIGRTFIMPTQRVRENALKVKLKPIESVIRGRKVMVVDDSIVRGTTSKRIVQLLRDFGAEKVYLLSTFPPIRNPCLYGIDFTSEKELIAHGRSLSEIEREIGADRLIYMSPEDLKGCLGLKDMCMACVDGVYPTSTADARDMQEQRQRDYERVVCR